MFLMGFKDIISYTSGLCCWSILWEQPFCDSDADSVPYTLHARSKCICPRL